MTDKKRDLTPRTPGEPVEPKSMPPQAEEQDLALAEADQAIEQDDAEISAEAEARIEAEVVRRLKALQKVNPQKNPLMTAAELPNAHEVDATKIKRAVLTNQGYVVPTPPPAKVA